jgi:hypothetical protein
VEPEKTSIARQRLGKHIPAATEKPISKQQIGKHTTIEVLLKNVFSLLSVQSGYKDVFS